ncbi:hypothetical protein L208DRAFT_1408391 [Tricholoma matsutake]|nr:hypothetical protein L208DRAFT_1408391 [Tricholoma matsutake 945]
MVTTYGCFSQLLPHISNQQVKHDAGQTYHSPRGCTPKYGTIFTGNGIAIWEKCLYRLTVFRLGSSAHACRSRTRSIDPPMTGDRSQPFPRPQDVDHEKSFLTEPRVMIYDDHTCNPIPVWPDLRFCFGPELQILYPSRILFRMVLMHRQVSI